MAAAARFDIDIKAALTAQLLEAFDRLTSAALTTTELASIENEPGVYKLYLDDTLVYVGKTDGSMRSRLTQHMVKIGGRKNITLADITFLCLYVGPNWTALAPETNLIAYWKAQGLCDWNGSGFGIHDPGRNREDTNKPPHGFDAMYPIREDWPCDWIEPERHNAAALLSSLKGRLPYLLRYERPSGGHPDYNAAEVDIPVANMPADQLLALITAELQGWQATAFPSHLILYKENRDYVYGRVIARG
jgi:hypothetical protein